MKKLRLKSDLDEFHVLLTRIHEDKPIIIVEGKKDRDALLALGCTGILTLWKKALFEVVEEVVKTGQSCIILTDLDPEGRKLFAYLYRHLQHHGVICDNSLREFLFRTPVRQIETLPQWMRKESVQKWERMEL